MIISNNVRALYDKKLVARNPPEGPEDYLNMSQDEIYEVVDQIAKTLHDSGPGISSNAETGAELFNTNNMNAAIEYINKAIHSDHDTNMVCMPLISRRGVGILASDMKGKELWEFAGENLHIADSANFGKSPENRIYMSNIKFNVMDNISPLVFKSEDNIISILKFNNTDKRFSAENAK